MGFAKVVAKFRHLKRMGNHFWKFITLIICHKKDQTSLRMSWRCVLTATNVVTIRTTERNSQLGFMTTLEDLKRNKFGLSD